MALVPCAGPRRALINIVEGTGRVFPCGLRDDVSLGAVRGYCLDASDWLPLGGLVVREGGYSPVVYGETFQGRL